MSDNNLNKTTPKVYCSFSKMTATDSLVENPKNPKRHPEAQLKALVSVIEFNGWRGPVVVSNRSGLVIKGHGRLQAAKLAGWTEVPVDFQDYASEAEELADMIADNQTSELAEFDNISLASVLDELNGLTPNAAAMTAFTQDELVALLAQKGGEVTIPSTKKVEFNATTADDVEKITCPFCNKTFAK